MTTTSQPERKREGHTSFVPESRYNLWKVINGILPQTGVGIEPIITNDVIHSKGVDTPEFWDEFVRSQLSGSQLEDLAKLMTNMHRGNKIAAADTTHAKSHEKPIDRVRLNKLWQTSRRNIMHTLISQLDSKRYGKLYSEADKETRERVGVVREIADLLDSPVWSSALAELFQEKTQTSAIKRMLEAYALASQAILTPVVRELAVPYKMDVAAIHVAKTRLTELLKHHDASMPDTEEIALARKELRMKRLAAEERLLGIRKLIVEALQAAGYSEKDIHLPPPRVA